VIRIINIGVLASTNATDLQAVIDAIESNQLNAKISVVISDKLTAKALVRANKHDIEAIFIDPKAEDILNEKDKEKQREIFDKKAAKIFEENNVELILAIGYMRFLSPWFVNKYKNKIMNIHPSLLPKFAGGMDKNVHEAVLEAGEKTTGCTLHFVDEGADTGPIILQKEVPIEEDETVNTLKEKVQKAEQEVIIKAIKLYDEGKIKVEDNKVIIA
jgi:phosphoribosylglycinamide formyltransferase-1|tara:strand:+ start:1194 stop:1841 length:648 start_codon:yes stop_codon:yes gene_type:complete